MSLTPLSAFEFKKKNTIIHNLDPRSKLFFTVILSIIILQYNSLIPIMIIFISLIPLITFAKVVREWIASLKGLTFLIFFIFVIDSLYYSSYTPLADSSSPTTFALAMVIRLLALVTAFSIFFQTVHPDDLGQALVKLKVPYNFAWALSTAYRFVPTLAKEAQTIMDAQMSRGLELQSGNLIKRIKNFIPIIIPLFVSSIRRAWQLAEAMDSRAWGASKKRTFYYEITMSNGDYVLITITIVILLFQIYITYYLGLPEWVYWQLPYWLELQYIIEKIIQFFKLVFNIT